VSTKAPELNRLLFVDTLRGLAVLFMIQLHTSHGWLRPDVRSGTVWSVAQFLGGLAAPSFLFLAGASMGLQWGHAEAAGRPLQPLKHIARGLQLVVMGYALRLQMWVIDGGAYARPGSYFPILTLTFAYVVAHYALGKLPRAPGRAAWSGMLAAAAWCAGILWLRMYEPVRLRGLLRVDVLQCIGASLVLLNLLAAKGRMRLPRSVLLLGLTVLAGLATAWLRPLVPGALPEALAGYIVQWSNQDNKPVLALFPLLPWVGFACIGAVCGLGWSRASDAAQLELQLIVVVALGAYLALITSESWTPAYMLARKHAWLGPLLRLGYKIGLVCVLMGVALAITRARTAAFAPLQTLGRASLLVYWVHLEFAFGVAAKPVVRGLDLPGWALGTFGLMVAMWVLASARLHISLDALRGLRRGTATS
jgi:uncharacterized membrane protein